jgi:hypothetical protein
MMIVPQQGIWYPVPVEIRGVEWQETLQQIQQLGIEI